ncbi:hypothetical protein F2Q68_00031143 [Brassica cretica]|uniref:Uncharacterized protein n=1 Tax=Brassica cretica TaxID=69181 RepID=A0A8S9G6H7_BRACR|nr:hypothetical protein F2Q68_00031143 [Brassica cretica]
MGHAEKVTGQRGCSMRKRVGTAMSAKCAAHFKRFCEYISNQEVGQNKRLLLGQASSTEKCLEKLASKGLFVLSESILEIFGVSTRDDHQARPLVDIEEE